MIKFFRNIRQKLLKENKTTSYLKYAIGEIVLVVIGILIALQINNWNTARKEHIAQKMLLENFNEDLKADADLLDNYLQLLSGYIETQEEIQKARKGVLDPENIKNPKNFRGSIRYHSIVLNNHPDIATKISNDKLRDAILTYYQDLSELNNAYHQFHDVILNIVRPYLAQNNLLNSDFLFNHSNQVVPPFFLDDFYRIIMTREFGQVLFEANIKANETKTLIEKILIENKKLSERINTVLK